jgi:hypothetical protein
MEIRGMDGDVRRAIYLLLDELESLHAWLFEELNTSPGEADGDKKRKIGNTNFRNKNQEIPRGPPGTRVTKTLQLTYVHTFDYLDEICPQKMSRKKT